MENSTKQKILSVTELTRNIRGSLESNPEFTNLWIKGEISNLTLHSSGHIYFTLKDEGAVISAVFFKNSNKGLAFKLEEGLSVLAFGGVTVFEKRGSYQFNVNALRLEGIGELQKKIEQLKIKLGSQGVFDNARKRPLPFLPKKIGIVTSPTGAAIRDIMKVALRRYPNIQIIIAPAKVQGDDSPKSIVRAIAELNKPEYGIDLIIAARGGGSFEDLIAFSDEAVVMAFYSSRVPIVSAVGHQIDHPLSDDAADMFAPTPSAAAELCVPLKSELKNEIEYISRKIKTALAVRMRESRARVQTLSEKKVFRAPMDIVNLKNLYLSDVEGRMIMAMKDIISSSAGKLNSLPDIRTSTAALLKERRHRLSLAIGMIEQLSPLGVMRRGYSIAVNENGIIRKTSDAVAGSPFKLRLADGSLSCVVNSLNKGDIIGKEEIKKFG